MRNSVKLTSKKTQQMILFVMPFILIVTAFIVATPIELIHGMYRGIIWNNRLISDAFQVMGIGATLLNAGLIGLFGASIVKYYDMKPNGLIIAATMLMIGFAFIGKNVLNIIPIFIGGYLYSKYKKMPFRSIVISSMLATTIAPLISSLASISVHIGIGLIIAISSGILFGFFLPAISSQAILAHHGYSLYNMGFAAGLAAMVFHGVLKSSGIHFEGNMLIYPKFPTEVALMFLVIFIIYIFIGFKENDFSFQGLIELSRHPGKLVSDFTRICGFPVSMLNIGLLGVFSLLICWGMKCLNGPVICGMMSVVAFGAFGKHFFNTIPIQIGIILGSLLITKQLNTTLILMTMFLGTSLAPIAGEFGIHYGIITGVLHMFFVWNISPLHGGINLYNNGLSAGILAMVLIPCIQLIKGELE